MHFNTNTNSASNFSLTDNIPSTYLLSLPFREVRVSWEMVSSSWLEVSLPTNSLNSTLNSSPSHFQSLSLPAPLTSNHSHSQPLSLPAPLTPSPSHSQHL